MEIFVKFKVYQIITSVEVVILEQTLLSIFLLKIKRNFLKLQIYSPFQTKKVGYLQKYINIDKIFQLILK